MGRGIDENGGRKEKTTRKTIGDLRRRTNFGGEIGVTKFTERKYELERIFLNID